MEIGIAVLLVVGCAAGFGVFRKNTVPRPEGERPGERRKLSVIIPARNEADNLPHLLASLQKQTLAPDEIIVVDDFSEDGTKEIARRYGVTVLENSPLPDGWTGKNWAVWNGYLHASGDLLAFLDADVRLAPQALEALVRARERAGGVISVVPFHQAVRFYEKLALVTNLLGLFAFTSPWEKHNPQKGLYGSCIVAARADYERVCGHESVRSEVLDDLTLGARCVQAGIPVTNYIGCGLVSFRMYPGGIRSEIEGFGKSAALSTSKLSARTVLLIALWVIGLLASECAPFLATTPWGVPLALGYLLYMLQIFYLVKYTGDFGKIMPVLHLLSSLFFIGVMLYSVYQVAFLGRVSWKGRHIRVGGRRSL